MDAKTVYVGIVKILAWRYWKQSIVKLSIFCNKLCRKIYIHFTLSVDALTYLEYGNSGKTDTKAGYATIELEVISVWVCSIPQLVSHTQPALIFSNQQGSDSQNAKLGASYLAQMQHVRAHQFERWGSLRLGGSRCPLSYSCLGLGNTAMSTFRWGTAAGSNYSLPHLKGPHLHRRSVWSLDRKTKIHANINGKVDTDPRGPTQRQTEVYCTKLVFSVMKSNLTQMLGEVI